MRGKRFTDEFKKRLFGRQSKEVALYRHLVINALSMTVIKGKYTQPADAKAEIFYFIEMFYNPINRHSHTGDVSPAKFEENYFVRLQSV